MIAVCNIVWSLCCQGITTLLYLISTDMYMLINYVSFVNWLAIGLSVVALLYFRYTRPNASRPIKVGVLLCNFFIILLVVVEYVGLWVHQNDVVAVQSAYNSIDQRFTRIKLGPNRKKFKS